MNALLKTLSALALISVIIAASVFVYKSINPVLPPVVVIKPPVSGGDGGPKEKNPPVDGPVTNPVKYSLSWDFSEPDAPAKFAVVRKKGYTYTTSVKGIVRGKGRCSDWGLSGLGYFEYTYFLKCKAKIIENTGLFLIQELEFGQLEDILRVSDLELSANLPAESLEKSTKFLADGLGGTFPEGVTVNLGFLKTKINPEGIGKVGTMATTLFEKINSKRLPVTQNNIEICKKMGLIPEKFSPEDLVKAKINMLSTDQTRPLVGRKIRIEITTVGAGEIDVRPVDGRGNLTTNEVNLIRRTNYAMDYFLFPDEKVDVGREWDVNAAVLGGFLDPKMRGKVDGSVKMKRAADIPCNDTLAKRLKLKSGYIKVIDDTHAGRELTGEVFPKIGECVLPNEFDGVVTSAYLKGDVVYKELSTDHLLWATEFEGRPNFEIFYKCNVEKSEK